MGIDRVGVILDANLPGGNCLGGNFPRWEFSGLELSGGNHPSGNFPSGSFPSTGKFCSAMYKIQNCCDTVFQKQFLRGVL